MNTRRSRPDKNRAFALIVTLIMLVLAAGITVGLLTSASLDRNTSRSNFDRYQADLAVQNGLEAAKRALSTDGSGNAITADDTFIITRVSTTTVAPSAEDTTPHYYFIGRAKTGGTQVSYYPLFSGGGGVQTVTPAAQPSFTGVGTGSNTATNLPVLLPNPAASPSPAPPLLPAVTTQWMDLGDPAAAPSAPKVRYCYWIEDLGGYVDASVTGNTSGPSTSHTRDLTIMQPLLDAKIATPASLIALWTLFNSTSSDPTASPQQQYNANLVGHRDLLFTSDGVKQTLANPAPSPTLAELSLTSRHVVAGSKADSEQLIIPYGISSRATSNPIAWYANAGQPKIDLNAQIAAQDVTGIATAIKDNLPDWASMRRGGFGGTGASAAADDAYRKTIAANIIDYADTDSDASIGTNYRGIDSYPFVSEFYDYLNWTGVSADSITIEITTWLELWNMSNQTATGTVKLKDYYRHRLNLGAYTYFDDDHDPEKPSAGESVSGVPFASQSLTIGPNEYKVLKFGPATYTLQTGGSIPASPLTLTATNTGRYELQWQSSSGPSSQLVDAPLTGVRMNSVDIYNPAASSTKVPYKWDGSLPGFGYGTVAFYNPGDPRASWYIKASQAVNDYSSNATMWSRNAKPSSSLPIGQEVKPSRWPDGGHETPLISPVGLKDTVSPPTTRPANAPAIQPTKAPAYISNAGKFITVTELGHIFDPAQWNIVPTNNRWSDIDSSTLADQSYGGGFTLRVGRPEFSRFDQAGVRASQLLDLFTAGTRRETRGLINLNTASRETLRALGAGLLLNRDPDIVPTSLATSFYPPRSTDEADKFADSVIAARSTAPFISTSQLAQLRDTAGNSFFGNVAQWTSPQSPPTEWSDNAAEEYFARIFDLSAVRSRSFRVFVTGEAVDPRQLDPNGNAKVLATVRKVFQVFLSPSRAADGSIGAQKVEVTYEREL